MYAAKAKAPKKGYLSATIMSIHRTGHMAVTYLLCFADMGCQMSTDLDSDIGVGHVDVTLAAACPL